MMTHAAATGSLPYPFHSHVPLHLPARGCHGRGRGGCGLWRSRRGLILSPLPSTRWTPSAPSRALLPARAAVRLPPPGLYRAPAAAWSSTARLRPRRLLQLRRPRPLRPRRPRRLQRRFRTLFVPQLPQQSVGQPQPPPPPPLLGSGWRRGPAGVFGAGNAGRGGSDFASGTARRRALSGFLLLSRCAKQDRREPSGPEGRAPLTR